MRPGQGVRSQEESRAKAAPEVPRGKSLVELHREKQQADAMRAGTAAAAGAGAEGFDRERDMQGQRMKLTEKQVDELIRNARGLSSKFET